jgi:hypothetical protein
MSGFGKWRALVGILLIVPLLVTACDEDSTGPEAVDLTGTAAELESTVQDYLVQNRALLSIAALSSAMAEACSGSSLDVASAFGLLDILENRAPRTLLDARDPAAISDICLGQSLVMNSATMEYETGGPGDVPDDGVRFELYDVDASGELITPLDPIGYVEIVDSSNESMLAGAFTAVVDGATLLDFSGSLTGGETSLNLEGEGFFSIDGSTQLEVSLEGGFDVETGDISGSAQLETSEISSTVSFEGAGSVEGETVSGTFNARVDHGGTTIVFDGEIAESGDITGEVVVNGEVVATFSVDVESETFQVVDASDGMLTDADIAALEGMFDTAVTGLGTLLVVGLLLFVIAGTA